MWLLMFQKFSYIPVELFEYFLGRDENLLKHLLLSDNILVSAHRKQFKVAAFKMMSYLD